MRIGITVCAIALLMTWGSIASAETPKEDTLLERAKLAYGADRTYTYMHLNQGTHVEEHKYEQAYIPIKDLFGSRVDSITWDNKSKVAKVSNEGSSLVFNLSKTDIQTNTNEIVFPREWYRMNKGKVEIRSAMVAYLFDRYGEDIQDQERDQWEEKLSFLGIEETSAIPGVRDRYLYVYVTFEEVKDPSVEDYNSRIKNNIKIGMSQEQLYGHISEPSYRSDNDSVWRYDLIATEGYTYSGVTEDLSGLQNGDVDIQLFVYWDDKKAIEYYEVWYADQTSTGREVFHYRTANS